MVNDIPNLKHIIDIELKKFVENFYSLNPDSSNQSSSLHPAIRYILEGEGKRVRGTLCLLTAQAFDTPLREALPSAIALELIHAYSLVHDDLPSMDNDDFRRGRPTAHKKYDEATALLAGDGLLTDAFTILSGADTYFEQNVSPQIAIDLIKELSSAAGSHGMVLGQSLDLYWTAKTPPSMDTILEIHRLKTGYLMGAATAMGAIVAKANSIQVKNMREFGQLLGLTFQILDDLLDIQSGIGKTPGKDRAAGKITFLTFLTEEKAKIIAQEYTTKGANLLKTTTNTYHELLEYSNKLLSRQF